MSKNLKGSTVDKNLIDIHFKLYSLKESKSSRKGEYRSHSINIMNSRNSKMKEFVQFLKDNNLANTKLNLAFTNEIVKSFLEQRVNNNQIKPMQYKSQETYIRGFVKIIDALRVQNIEISLDRSHIDNYLKELKQSYQAPDVKTIHKSFVNVDNVITQLYENKFASGLLGEILNTHALRISEGMELISNYKKYVNDKNEISNFKGKNGKVYAIKTMLSTLLEKIKYFHQNNLKLPSKKGFANSIHKIEKGKTPHSFRYEAVKREHSNNLKNGMTYKHSLAKLSIMLNHKRCEISQRYLLRV